MTAVSQGPLGFLSARPGLPDPGISTLNSSKGYVIANAAIVPRHDRCLSSIRRRPTAVLGVFVVGR